MTKIKWLQKRMIENISYTYRIFLLLFSLLLAVFLTSKLWLPSDVSIQNTAVGTMLSTTESVGVRLQSWQYNPSTRFMEATFTYQNSDNFQNIKFIPIAHTDTNKAVNLDVAIPYEHNGLIVVQIQNVPQKWNVISLWIDSQQEQTVDLSQPDSEADTDTEGQVSRIQQGANFFCDVRKVVRNSSLKSQSSLYYSLKSIDNEISTVQSHTAQTNKKVAAANLNIQQLTSDISVLNDNQKYQTADEVKQSKDAVQSKTSQISDLKNSIVQFQTDIKNDQLKVQKLRQKWNDTRDGKYKDSGGNKMVSAPASSSSLSSKPTASTPEKVMVD